MTNVAFVDFIKIEIQNIFLYTGHNGLNHFYHFSLSIHGALCTQVAYVIIQTKFVNINKLSGCYSNGRANQCTKKQHQCNLPKIAIDVWRSWNLLKLNSLRCFVVLNFAIFEHLFANLIFRQCFILITNFTHRFCVSLFFPNATWSDKLLRNKKKHYKYLDKFMFA